MHAVAVGCIITLCMCLVVTKQQNSTTPRRSGHRDSNLMSAIQQMQTQLNAIETESQRHNSRIQEVLRATTRIETQRQELINTLDRSESRLSQRLDDIKGDARKIITLQDVMREDFEKMQQNQLLTKIWIEEQLRHVGNNPPYARSEAALDSTSALHSNADILANLQILQTTLTGLRRMADTLQSSINTVKVNITDLTNITRLMLQYEQEALVTKTFLMSSLQMLSDEKTDQLQLIGYVNPISNQDPIEKLPRDCYEVQRNVRNESGVYRIQMNYAPRPIFVYCDMETDGGGWTVFQRRRDGSIDFLREWQDYKHGFGNVGSEFWLGNENLYLLTHQDLYELRIDLRDFEEGRAFAKYGGFAVGSEKEKYMLKLLGPLTGGDAGDGMTYHASMPFSTIDVDNDRWEGGHCAKDHTGGWWYNQCDASNLNGKYLNGMNPHEYQGVYWHEWQGPSYSLMFTQMMIRPMGHAFLAPPRINISISGEDVKNEIEHEDAQSWG